MSTSREKLGLALGCIGMLAFAGTLPATRLAVAVLDPWFLTAARGAIAGCFGLAVLLLTRCPVPPRANWLDLGVVGLCNAIGYPLFGALALVTVPAAHGGVVLGIGPIATAAAAALLAGERPSLGFWLAGVAGGALVATFALRGGASGALASGDLLLVGSIGAAAIGYTLSGRLMPTMRGWEVICWAVVAMLPIALPATWVLWPPNLAAPSPRVWAALGYVAIVSQVLAFFVWNAAMAIGGIARVAQLQLLQPFTVVALAAVINGESIEAETILFATAVVATVLIGQRMRVARRVPDASRLRDAGEPR
jgi:drug/metabolite transporter (DMT)-like permease